MAQKVYVVSEAGYHNHEENYDGICLACGKWSFGGCEPDAEDYECEACGEKRVWGVSQALIAGYLDIGDSEDDEEEDW